MMTAMALLSTPPKSLCILRLSAIGDCINAVALVQAIQRQWPDTHITWIMGPAEASLLSGLKNVEIIVFHAKHGWKAYFSLWNALKQRHFDVLLHLQNALKASIASLGIRAKYRLGFDAIRSGDGQRFFINTPVHSPGSPHVLDGFLAFAQSLGISDPTADWNLPISGEDYNWTAQWLSSQSCNLVLSPGTSKTYKNWTPEGYATVANYAARKGVRIILTGGNSAAEKRLIDDIKQHLQCAVIDLSGKSTLKQLAALIEKAQVVIAPDTGAVHIANAVNTPVIGLYAHHNPERVGPYRFLQYTVSVYEQCLLKETGKRPNEVKWRTRIKDPQAMQLITPDMVIQQFDQVCQDYHLLTQE